jgi:outer membrane lipoprotein-sorting protein
LGRQPSFYSKFASNSFVNVLIHFSAVVPVLQRIASSLGLILFLAALAHTQTPDLNTIVNQMVAVQHEDAARAHAFSVKRDYQILDRQMESKAKVVATITFVPPDQRQYTIESAQGGIGERVLRDFLARENEHTAQPKHKELGPENYDFRLTGSDVADGRRCYVLELLPKRQEKELLRGRAWVDAETFQIRRVEGAPVKSPSWWVRDLYILMSFAEVDGMWLRTITHATANIRFKGKYVMVVRDLEYRTAPDEVGRNTRREIFAGAVINP